MITLDAEKIWGTPNTVAVDEEAASVGRLLNDEVVVTQEHSKFKLEIAASAGVYGATAGCSIGSIALAFGRQKVMAIFVALAILGLIIQAFAFENINAAIVGRLFYGFAAGVFFCMAPKIIQENTLQENFERRWSVLINLSQTGMRLISVALLNGDISR